MNTLPIPRRLLLLGLVLPVLLGAAAPSAQAIETAALLDSLQHGAFDYFWNEANPDNGLIKDRSTSSSPCSIASVGFGLTAICIGIDHGWIDRATGRARVRTTLETLWNGPQGPEFTGNMGYQGLFYHWLDMTTGLRTWDCELSTIDTALLFAGIIDAREYFEGGDPEEAQIRELADSITQRANWEFARNFGPGIRLGWKPDTGFSGYGNWIGYNEAMILYLIALGSPTHPVPESTWATWTSGYNWSTQYGQQYVIFPPLFGHQYSHCWVDFRGSQDAYMAEHEIDYFENSRRATLAAQAYCIDNPLGQTGYSDLVWGLTASDDPWGYLAHGAPPAQNDNGTITPTAAVSSIAFAPELAIPTAHYFYDTYGPLLWGPYGFRDAFNLDVYWWDTDYLGIDQGPIIIMIENYLNERVWSRFMRSPDIQTGMARAGFTTPSAVEPARLFMTLGQNHPNPMRGESDVDFTLTRRAEISLKLYDVAGRELAVLAEGNYGAGQHRVSLSRRDLPAGVYLYVLESGGRRLSRRCLQLK